MHVRTQIRRKAAEVLTEGMRRHTVFSSRKAKINEDSLPMVDMRFLNENSQYTTMGNVLDRTGSLYIRVTRSAQSDDLDDDLDADAVVVEHLMAGADFGDLIKEGELVQTNFTDEADGDKAVGEVILRYDVSYRTADNDVETAKG